MKRLPLGELTFREIIEGDYLYVDKTRYIHNLLKSKLVNQYFLSRPGRFGKTLLLDTIKTVFTDGVESFKDLWIGRTEYAFERCPVISLDLSAMNSDSPERLRDSLMSALVRNAKAENLVLSGGGIKLCFISLIRGLSEKYKSNAVVLVDEYDSPILTNLDAHDLAEKNRDVLCDIFKILKTAEVNAHLRFALITGRDGFALNSMYSAVNHLVDISMKPEFDGICGFTADELETNFTDRMEHTLTKLKEKDEIDSSANANDLKDQIYYRYGGYGWSGETEPRILNTYSILKFFENCHFDNYWFQAGPPSGLTTMMRQYRASFVEPDLEYCGRHRLMMSALDSREPFPFLFHSGHLTIDKIIIDLDRTSSFTVNNEMDRYVLKFPNYEVSSTFKNYFTALFSAMK
jgi:hypothetical protein